MDPRKRVPIRWLAPETLRTAMYTQKTDVFSYGIMCWEIFANGQEPYPGFTVAEVNVRVSFGSEFISCSRNISINIKTVTTIAVRTARVTDNE